jgi:hypothetical protein
MKSIKEKQLLVRWARAMNEPVDPALAEEVDRYNQLQEEVKESIRSNTINDLFDASKVAIDIINKVTIDYPKPPTLEELLSIVQEESNELVQAQAAQASLTTEETPTPSSPRTDVVEPTNLISRAVSHIHKEVRLEASSFQQPQPTPVEKNFNDVQKKLKFLEQAIRKIAATGPGSGEVELKRLDDVNYTSVLNATDGQALVYNSANALWEATTLSGSGGPETDTLNTVTNRGNVTTNGITVNNANVNWLGVNTSAGVAVTTGQIAWNAADLTFDMGMANGVTLQVGQEQYIKVKAGSVISDGQAVMFAGADGEHIIAVPNDVSTPGYIPEWFIGIATQDLALNAFGYVTTFGKVNKLNTLAWSVGDILYADPLNVGGLVNAEPVAPYPNIVVAAVTKRAGGDGHILVRPTWRSDLHQLNDVFINGATSGQVLTYQDNVWINRNITSANVTELTNLFFTNARVYSNVTQLGYITTSSLTGYATNTQLTSYATTANVSLKANVVDLTTANVTEVTNLYFSNARVYSNVTQLGYITNSALVGYATNTQLTSYATTANLSLKANVADLKTANVAEVTNLYFTNARAVVAVTNTSLSNITISYTPATSTGHGLVVNAANTQGGTGYADFLKVTNTSGGTTNSNKSFRLNSAGGIEIINSAYTSTIFSLSDSGSLNTGQYQVNGKQAVNGPAFSAYPTSPAQTIATNSNTRVNLGNEEYDIGGCYDAPNGKFLPNVEGYYQLNATVRIDGSSGTGERMIVIYKNGSEYKRGTNEAGTEAGATFYTLSVSCQAYANGSSDYFEVYVYQNSGNSRTVSEYQQISYFQGCMIRGA